MHVSVLSTCQYDVHHQLAEKVFVCGFKAFQIFPLSVPFVMHQSSLLAQCCFAKEIICRDLYLLNLLPWLVNYLLLFPFFLFHFYHPELTLTLIGETV